MDEKSNKVDKEKIELIMYERSKWWSKFFSRTFKSESCDEYLLEDLGYRNYKGDGEEEEKAYQCVEMAEEGTEDDDDEDGDGNGVMALTQDLTVSNAQGILAQINQKANETGIVDTKVQKILEETLPIIQEYKKDWRIAGLERILNTFDIKRIENEVGSWLRRYNGIANRTFISQPKDQYRSHEHYDKERRIVDYDTDSDSLHSFDTASYIRKCKKHLNIKKKVATTTTTIKSYRLIESKRNELRRKYAYFAPDDTMQMIYNKERCRKVVPSYRIIPVRMRDTSRMEKIHLSHKSRSSRKQHFHHRCSSPYTSHSSTDDEAPIKRNMFLKTRYGDCCRYYPYRIPESSHKNCHIANCRDISYNESYENLPYIHESECSCRGANELCKNARHIANSSTEDWFVENCESPQNILRKLEEPMPKEIVRNDSVTTILDKDKTIQRKVDSKSYTCQPKTDVTTKPTFSQNSVNNLSPNTQKQMIGFVNKIDKNPLCEDVGKNVKGIREISERKENCCSTKTNVVKGTKLQKHDLEIASKTNKKNENKTSKAINKKPKNKTSKPKKKVNNSFEEDSDFQMAIEMSKKTYEEEMERILKNKRDMSLSKGNCKNNGNNTVPNGTHSYTKTSVNKADKSSADNTTHSATMLASHLSTQLQMDNTLKISKNKTTKTTLNTIKESETEERDSNEIIIKKYGEKKFKDKMQFSKETTTNSRKVNFSENTFFAHSDEIYNSTALGNNTATSRQIFINAKNKSKSIEDTLRVVNCKPKVLKARDGIEKSSNDIKITDQENEEVSKENSDCMIISSTTNSDLQETVIPSTATKRTNKTNERILLYSPNNQSAVPNDSIINGRFKVTEDHLASFVGQKVASKFMKYYRGQRQFKETSTVYYKPPRHEIDGNDSTDSEIDILDLCHQYGELVEIKTVG